MPKKLKNYLVNLNLYTTCEISAHSEKHARELAESMSKDEIMEHLEEEVDNCGLEIGTIDCLDE